MRKLFVSLLFGIATIAICSGQNPVDSARVLFNQFSQAKAAGDFSLSEVILTRILEGEYNLPDYHQALVRNNLGIVYSERGRLEEANLQYQIAEDLVPGSTPDELQLRISIKINQAIYHKNLGDYANALHYNNEALRLLNSIPKLDEVSLNKLSAILLNKGITLYLLGRYNEALEILKECEQIKKSHNHPYLGSVFFNLARTHQILGDTELASQNYLKGIEQWISEYDADYYELANIYLHFGQFLTIGRQAEQGKDYLQKALENYKRNFGSFHPLTAACYENLAKLSLTQNNFDQALNYLQAASNSISPGFEGTNLLSNPDIESPSHKLTLLKILATKVKVLEGISKRSASKDKKKEYLEAALATNLLSIHLLHKIQGSFFSDESRIFLTSGQKDLFATGIRINLEMFRITGNNLYQEEAFLMAVRGKSSELIFEMDQKEWLYLESRSDKDALSIIDLKQQIDHFSNLIQTEQMEMNPDSVRLLNLQAQLFQTRDSFYSNMEQFRRDFPQIGQFDRASTDLTLDQIRRKLKRKETLVEYFITGAKSSDDDEAFIFVVSKKECHVHQSPIDPAFYQNLETIKENLHGFVPYGETNELFDSLKGALFGIYKEFVQPVEPLFSGNNLLIVPDEMLSYIPFDALISHLENEGITNYAGVPYLIKDYNITYLYNSQLLSRNRSRPGPFPDLIAWIPQSSTAKGKTFDKLRGATEEVQDILSLAKGESIQKPLEKSEVVDLLQKNSILHLAMHSLAAESTGMSPYFILDTTANPILTRRMHDYEINALSVSSPMVVLSSCETAGGELRNGEGIMSLSRSFLQAGAESVVHSLWPVEDSKSREIMTGFYRAIKQGQSKGEALSNAKRSYINTQPPFYTHPYYWAAFQVTGDGVPLNNKGKWPTVAGAILSVFLIFFYLRRRSFLRRS